jgi:hypothetical protein
MERHAVVMPAIPFPVAFLLHLADELPRIHTLFIFIVF